MRAEFLPIFSRVAADLSAMLAIPDEEIQRGVRTLAGMAAGEPLPVGEPRSIPDVIETAMREDRVVRVEYTRKYDGVMDEYWIRPYEVKPHPDSGRMVLYAQDERHGDQIHSFLWSRIDRAALTPEPFAPTWPTWPDTVP